MQKTTGFCFSILVCLCCMLFSCYGKVFSLNGTETTLLPGLSGRIAWSFDDTLKTGSYRLWRFIPNDGGEELLASINGVDDSYRKLTRLFEFSVETPGTLVLTNVNMTHNGSYKFSLQPSTGVGESEVLVFIAKKPAVAFNCSSSVTLNEGDDFTCVCRGEDGNPPANVTWFKEGEKIGGTEKEKKTLSLRNVNGTNNGTYTCEARSHTNDSFKDEKSVELRVRPNSKPNITSFTSVIEGGKKVTLACKSDGVPKPDYMIKFNGSVVSTTQTYVIPAMEAKYNGMYTCIANNKLGSDSATFNFTFQVITPSSTPTPTTASTTSTVGAVIPTTSTTTSTTSTVGPVPPDTGKKDVNIGLIIGIIIGVLVLILILGIVLYCYKSKKKNGGNRANIDPIAGNHYELENEAPDAGGDNAYDTVGPVGASGSKKKPPQQESLPPVYAAVDKNNRQGNTLYASLDTEAMQPKRESKKEPDRTPQTEYASIDFAKSAKDVPKADLV